MSLFVRLYLQNPNKQRVLKTFMHNGNIFSRSLQMLRKKKLTHTAMCTHAYTLLTQHAAITPRRTLDMDENTQRAYLGLHPVGDVKYERNPQEVSDICSVNSTDQLVSKLAQRYISTPPK